MSAATSEQSLDKYVPGVSAAVFPMISAGWPVVAARKPQAGWRGISCR